MRQTSPGDDAVDVGVVHEVLPPRMENIGSTDLDAETRPGAIGKRLGRRLEKNGVDQLPVSQGKGVELLRQGEDDMEVLDGEELFPPCLDPLLFS